MINLPYEKYESNKVLFKTEVDYKNRLKEMSEKYEGVNFISRVDTMFSRYNYKNAQLLRDFLRKYKDRIKYILDSSYYAVYICVDENAEKWFFHYDRLDDRIPSNFKEMPVRKGLEWLVENCDFIPLYINTDYPDWNDEESYKYSHIRNEKQVINKIQGYLSNLQYPPRDNIYYFLRHDYVSGSFYLERDLNKSPRKEK